MVDGDYAGPAHAGEGQVSAFVDDVFGELSRADQRRWARIYLRGLLIARGKKTVQQLARSVGAETFVARGLSQFINFSPWEWSGPRRRLAAVVRDTWPVEALTIGVCAIPKRGSQSVGVQRRFLMEAGRTINCQLAVSLFQAARNRLIPVDWELALGPEWSTDTMRRARARIPDSVRPRTVWQHALDLIGRSGPDPAGPPVVADLSELDEAWPLAAQLASQRDVLIAVRPGQRVPACRVGGARLSPTVQDLLHTDAGAQRHRITVCDEHGVPRPVSVHSVILRGPRADGLGVLGEWSSRSRRYTRYWLTSMASRPAQALALGRYADRTAATLAELRTDFGLLDYEGRSFPGWHHHMTMVSAAYYLRSAERPHALPLAA